MNSEHTKIKALLLPYLEGKLGEEERKMVEEHIKVCKECREEIEKYENIEEGLKMMKLKQPSKEVWDNYWSSVYNKLERKIGWIFFSIGAIILLFFGVYQFIDELIKDPTTPLVVKIGILLLSFGGVVLFVSILREQLFSKKKERYEEVEK